MFKIKFSNYYGALMKCNNFNDPIDKKIWSLEVFDFRINLHYGNLNTEECKKTLGRTNFKNLTHNQALTSLCAIQNYNSNHIKKRGTGEKGLENHSYKILNNKSLLYLCETESIKSKPYINETI